jgi:hypothetical protein
VVKPKKKNLPLDFNYDECCVVLHRALMDALTENRKAIRALNKTEPLWAVSYEILPWDPYIGVAFRLESESGHGASLNSAEWKHSHFIEDISTKALIPAKDYVHQAYLTVSGDGNRSQEVAHLIFLAEATALLENSVATLLQSVGIDAPTIGDSLPWNYFKYIVSDGDGVIKANYCDIVCANRVSRRLLGRVP